MCTVCPMGSYCMGGIDQIDPTPCPLHTTTLQEGSDSVSSCSCLPGYVCSYARRVRLSLALNTTMTLPELQANADLANALSNGVLAAMGLLGLSGVSASFEGFTAATVTY
jgi:hypothetical protein